MSRPPRRLHVERLEDRLTPSTAGTLDPAFGTGGIVTLPTQSIGPVVTLSNGQILAIVSSGPGSLERFNADGSADATFGAGGTAALSRNGVTCVVSLPNGGGLVAGSGTDPATNNTDIFVARYTPAGQPDPTFGTDGTVTVTFPDSSLSGAVTSALVQPDGRVVLVGYQTQSSTLQGANVTTGQMIVIRLTASGQPDPTFGTDGTAVVPFPVGQFGDATADGAVLQPDGRIVLVGSAASTGQIAVNGSYSYWQTSSSPVAVRLTSAGQLDPTFGTGGRVLITSPPVLQSTTFRGGPDVGVLANGGVLLTGEIFSSTGDTTGVAIRLTGGGQLDTSYGSGGLGTTPTIGYMDYLGVSFSAAIDQTGRVVFASSRLTSHGSFWLGGEVSRLTADGAPDAQFGTNGQAGVGSGYGLVVRAVFPNGNILVTETNSNSMGFGGDGLLAEVIGSNPPTGFVPAGTGTVAVGGAVDGTFQVLTPTGGTYAATGTVAAYPSFAGDVRVATADVNGDGVPDYVVGAGPGGAPEVTIYDGKTGVLVADFPAFEASFTGGVFVAAADLTGDGKAEVVVTPDQGGGGRVVVLAISSGGAATPVASFFGIDDPNFRGGARVAVGDVNRDGVPDVVVAAGFGGGPRVAIFDGKSVAGGAPARVVNDFFAFPGADAATLRNGTYVAVGDVNGDGGADLVFGGGPGGAPRVFVLSGQEVASGNVAAAQASPIANFFVAGNTSDRGGVRVATTIAGGSGAAALVVGSGAGSPARVRVYAGPFTTPAEPSLFRDVSVFGGAALPDGVYVG